MYIEKANFKKDIHIGMYLYEEKGKVYLLTGKEEIVYFEKGSHNLKVGNLCEYDMKQMNEKFYLFQYTEEEGVVNFLGDIRDFDEEELCSHPFDSKEKILLKYFFRKRIEGVNMKSYFEKKQEIRDYVESLDINSIINNYYLERVENYNSRRETYRTWIAGFSSVRDIYINQLLPIQMDIEYKCNYYDSYIPNDIIVQMKECIKDEEKIKKEALENYDKEKHIDTLMMDYLRKRDEKKREIFEKCVLPKILLWDSHRDIRSLLRYFH